MLNKNCQIRIQKNEYCPLCPDAHRSLLPSQQPDLLPPPLWQACAKKLDKPMKLFCSNLWCIACSPAALVLASAPSQIFSPRSRCSAWGLFVWWFDNGQSCPILLPKLYLGNKDLYNSAKKTTACQLAWTSRWLVLFRLSNMIPPLPVSLPIIHLPSSLSLLVLSVPAVTSAPPPTQQLLLPAALTFPPGFAQFSQPAPVS